MNAFIHRILHSKPANLSAKIVLTGLAFWLVFRGVDFAQLSDIVERQDHELLLIAALLIAGQTLLGGFRWHLILKALAGGGKRAMSMLEAQKLYYISVFFNCCLPGTVGGDVIRIWLAKSDRVPLPLAIHSVIIDRLLALLALGVLAVATLPVMGDAAGFNGYALWPFIAILAIAGIYFLIHIDRLLQRFQHVRVVRWLLYFMGSLRLLVGHPTASGLSLLYAVVAHLCYCLCGYVLARSMHIELGLLQCITFVPLVLLLTTVPISIGGWGLREAGMVTLLGLVHVPQANALVLSIQLGLINILLSLPAGLLWLAYRRKTTPPASLPLL